MYDYRHFSPVCQLGAQPNRSTGKSVTPTALKSVFRMAIFFAISIFALGLAPRSAAAQTCTSPLCLFKNYFVTGDYVVGGVGLDGLGGTNGLATGTINIPDIIQCNATSAASCPLVPAGADAVAAWLIWITVESSSSPGAGQKGFFNGYPITGANVGNPKAPVSWSSGGCSGSSQGSKTMVAYIADVRPFLSLGSDGRPLINGSYTVQLPDNGANGVGSIPSTLGASLVIIYRLGSPSGPGAPPTPPLKSIVMYAGAYAPSNNVSSDFIQNIVGFYQAAGSLGADMTQIAGNGAQKKSETVSFNNVQLNSLYGSLPPFPGIYNGSWDNPRWSLDGLNVVKANDDTESTTVAPTPTNGNCVNWGAVIFSTPVPNYDNDGLLDVWKQGQGYNSINVTNNDYSGPRVALPGAVSGLTSTPPAVHPDVFVEVDYLSNMDKSAGSYQHSHLPKQRALDMVGDAYARHGIHVHYDVGSAYASQCSTTNPMQCPDPYIIQNGTGGNAISEGIFVCTATHCAFPGTPTVGWKGGFLSTKYNSSLSVPYGFSPALGNFQPGRASSYNYLLGAHALGFPRTQWIAAGEAPNLKSLAGTGLPTLVSIVVNNQGIGTITLLTSPLLLKPGDASCSDLNCDRVTVTGALQAGNAALNGTYTFLSTPSSSCTTTMCTTTLQIQTSGVVSGTYDYSSEPDLAVGYGGPTTIGGYSDIGGPDSATAFGLWAADDTPGCQPDPSVLLNAGQVYCIDQTGTALQQAGTILHEGGHNKMLTHGGTRYLDSSNPFSPTYGLNCSSNHLTMMNYLFQVRGFADNLGIVDYSGQTLPDLDEANLNEANGIGYDLSTNAAAAHYSRWFAPPNNLDVQLQTQTGGRYAKRHCDGTPVGPNEPPAVRVEGNTFSINFDWNNNLIIPDLIEPVAWQDVNFNGSNSASPDAPFKGFNDWAAPPDGSVPTQTVDLRQVGAEWNDLGLSSGGSVYSGGGSVYSGGGSVFSGGGSVYSGGGSVYSGGGSVYSGGGSVYSGGGSTEQDVVTVNSTQDAPTGLTAVLGNKTVVLNWTAPSGQINNYDIWRATGSFPNTSNVVANYKLFSKIGSVNRTTNPTPPPKTLPPATTFTDSAVKNNTSYTYFVTAKNVAGAQSGNSIPAVIVVKF